MTPLLKSMADWELWNTLLLELMDTVSDGSLLLVEWLEIYFFGLPSCRYFAHSVHLFASYFDEKWILHTDSDSFPKIMLTFELPSCFSNRIWANLSFFFTTGKLGVCL